MSEKKPNMAALYGAAYGFNTDRRVKPVHFATGFFVSLLGRQNDTEFLNNVVAFTDGKDHSGDYALPALHEKLKIAGKVGSGIGQRELHTLRKHLRSLANNDEAVFPIYGEREFGCDYTTASDEILTRTRDNDGFSGYFVHTVLGATDDGREVLEFARAWITQVADFRIVAIRPRPRSAVVNFYFAIAHAFEPCAILVIVRRVHDHAAHQHPSRSGGHPPDRRGSRAGPRRAVLLRGLPSRVVGAWSHRESARAVQAALLRLHLQRVGIGCRRCE